MRLLTDLLDLIGFLLLVSAATVIVGTWSIPGALATAGVGVLGTSWLIDWRVKR